MELVVIVFAVSLSLLLDFTSMSIKKSNIYALVGGLVSFFTLALLASDASLTIQSQLNPATGLYVAQTAGISTGEWRLAMIIIAIITVFSFLVSIHEEK